MENAETDNFNPRGELIMKIFKKFVSICAVLAMVLAMTVVTGTTAFADHETHTVKINDANGSDEHSYEAYQVFTGDLANGKLSNIEWGSGVNADALKNALNIPGLGYHRSAK